jgi:hypothetical protein
MYKTTLSVCCTAVWMGVLLSSCKEEPLPQENFPKFEKHLSASLQPASSCEELETAARNAAFLRIQANYSWRLEYALEQLRTLDSDACRYGYQDIALDSNTGEAGGGAPGSAPERGDGGPQVSGTNNQIAEVDEADIVKTGEIVKADEEEGHIYIAKGSQLRIFKSWPPETAKPLLSVPIKGQAKRLLKVGNRLLVISFVADNSYGYGGENQGDQLDTSPVYPYWDTDVLDPYPPHSSKTVLTLFDVTNPASPQELRKIVLKARFETARSIKDDAILVLSQVEPFRSNHFWWPEICDGNTLASARKLRADYIRALNAA